MYARQHLQALASPVLWQELVTVAQVSDLLLRRKVATALLVQRAKSLEATLYVVAIFQYRASWS